MKKAAKRLTNNKPFGYFTLWNEENKRKRADTKLMHASVTGPHDSGFVVLLQAG